MRGALKKKRSFMPLSSRAAFKKVEAEMEEECTVCERLREMSFFSGKVSKIV